MTTTKTVYLVRHGQSVDNVSPVFQSVNAPLSQKGEKQARLIAERIATVHVDALIASPVLRAKQTAEAIAGKTGKEIEFSDTFVERIKPTFIDGKAWDDTEALAVYRAWDDSLYVPDVRVQDGENYADIVSRADRALDFLRHRPENDIVVVTHGHFLRTMLARVLVAEELTGTILRRIQQVSSMENTAIPVLHYKEAYEEEARWRLWSHNDHAHFAE